MRILWQHIDVFNPFQFTNTLKSLQLKPKTQAWTSYSIKLTHIIFLSSCLATSLSKPDQTSVKVSEVSANGEVASRKKPEDDAHFADKTLIGEIRGADQER
jgi:hypothetical protein